MYDLSDEVFDLTNLQNAVMFGSSETSVNVMRGFGQTCRPVFFFFEIRIFIPRAYNKVQKRTRKIRSMFRSDYFGK